MRLIPKENSKFFKTYKQIDIVVILQIFSHLILRAQTSDNEKITIKLTQIETSKAVKICI